MSDALSVAIQGERGAFSEAAARKLVASPAIVPCRTFDGVFAAVRSGEAAAAVVPIENSLAGSVLRTYELLGGAGLEIAREALLRISLNLIARPGTKLGDVRRVLSHPVALAQCQRFLADLRGVEAIATYDTAGSVKMVMESAAEGEAAIAGATAAELYGGEILAAGVEDNAQNFTRFYLIAPPALAAELRPRDAASIKTSVLFRTPNTPGSLFRALAVFALRDINLTKLESRPIEGRPWEYAFYADISGSGDEPRVTNALNHLREMCETVVVLGSYAAADS
ncbi:MAG: prephenate dehydratase [Acidobacteria bacterium]|nr:prephenate dehydratase [Acidobacteriota bacterium]